jgi:hypothetical protein
MENWLDEYFMWLFFFVMHNLIPLQESIHISKKVLLITQVHNGNRHYEDRGIVIYI